MRITEVRGLLTRKEIYNKYGRAVYEAYMSATHVIKAEGGIILGHAAKCEWSLEIPTTLERFAFDNYISHIKLAGNQLHEIIRVTKEKNKTEYLSDRNITRI